MSVCVKRNRFLIILTVLAIVTRFYKIDSESLWLDEAFSFWFNDLLGNYKNILTHIPGLDNPWWDSHPFVYYFILNGWIKLIGTCEYQLRSLSALCGILTILLTYHLGKRFFNRKTGVLAAILMLMSPLNLWYSQEVRMYTLTSLLMLLSVYFFIALITMRRRLLNAIFYIISSSLLLYTDYVGLFVLFFQMLYVFCYLGFLKKHPLHIFLWCYCIILLLYIPWLPTLYRLLISGDCSHIPSHSIWSGLKVLLFYMVDAGVDDYQAALLPFVPCVPAKVLIGIGGLACWILSAFCVVPSLRKRSDTGIIVTLICCIPVTMFILSLTILRMFCSKQISSFVPEVALLIAAGFVCLYEACLKMEMHSLRRMLITVFLLVVAVNGYNFYLLYHIDTKENWRDPARYVEQCLQKNDTIVLFKNAQGPFQYYFRPPPGVIKGVNDFKEIKALNKSAERFWLIYGDCDKKALEAEFNQYVNDKAHEIIKTQFNKTNVIFYQIF